MRIYSTAFRKVMATLITAVILFSSCLTLDKNVVYADYNQGIVTFVTSLYSDCLGRTPDSAGLDDWCAKLASGQISGKQAAYGFFFSSEFQTNANSKTDDELIDAYYKVFLNRAADPSGKTYWAGQIAGTTNDISILFTGFADSTEFADKCASYGITAGSHIDVPTTTRGQATDGNSSIGVQSYRVIASNSYDSHNNLTNHEDYIYDELGNLIRVNTHHIDPLGMYGGESFSWTEYQYDNYGNVTFKAIHYDDHIGDIWERTEYDDHGNETRWQCNIGGADWGYVNFYDAQGFLVRRDSYDNRDGSYAGWTEYQYDARGNLIRESYHDGGWVTYQYDAQGNEIRRSGYDANTGSTWATNYQYDAQNHLIRQAPEFGDWREFQYDSNGNLLVETDYNGRKVYEYEPIG